MTSLCNELALDTEPALLGCLAEGVHCLFLGVVGIRDIHLDGNFGKHWLEWDLGLNGVVRAFLELADNQVEYFYRILGGY